MTKKNFACNNCRLAHKRCNARKGYSCDRCANRRLLCSLSSGNSSATNLNDQLNELSKQIENIADQYIELQQKQIALRSMLDTNEVQDPDSTSNEGSFFDGVLPVFSFDQHLTLVDCNESFCQLLHTSQLEVVQGTISELLPERNRNLWTELLKLMIGYPVTKFSGIIIMQSHDGTEVVVKMTIQFHQIYATATAYPVNYYSDGFTLNDTWIQDTFKIQHDNNQSVCKMLNVPTESILRLLDHLNKLKPDIPDKCSTPTSVAYSTPARTTQQDRNPTKLNPVRLSNDELQFIAHRLFRQKTNN